VNELAKAFVKNGGEIRENSKVTKIKDTSPIIIKVNGFVIFFISTNLL
jgi:L-2-hydroxyglutarate oxidase LhgO